MEIKASRPPDLDSNFQDTGWYLKVMEGGYQVQLLQRY
jgi:hypothetical protein